MVFKQEKKVGGEKTGGRREDGGRKEEEMPVVKRNGQQTVRGSDRNWKRRDSRRTRDRKKRRWMQQWNKVRKERGGKEGMRVKEIGAERVRERKAEVEVEGNKKKKWTAAEEFLLVYI